MTRNTQEDEGMFAEDYEELDSIVFTNVDASPELEWNPDLEQQKLDTPKRRRPTQVRRHDPNKTWEPGPGINQYEAANEKNQQISPIAVTLLAMLPLIVLAYIIYQVIGAYGLF